MLVKGNVDCPVLYSKEEGAGDTVLKLGKTAIMVDPLPTKSGNRK